MRLPLTVAALAALVLGPAPVRGGEPVSSVHHDLSVRLDPTGQRIDVTDRVAPGASATPDDDGAYRFVLHAGLDPTVASAGWKLEPAGEPVSGSFFGINATTDTLSERVPLEGWRLVPAGEPAWPVEIRYGGTIHHPIRQQPGEYQRSFSETPGIVSEDGVFLAGATFWVPTFGERDFVTFRLETTGLDATWDVVSQGRRVVHGPPKDGKRTTAWEMTHPTEEVYLVAGPWTEYADRAGEIDLFAFLRTPDPALADKYLRATRRYLAMYQEMLPPYPFASFSLVENFWETGYGMPGFTLLGPRVIRFPWILTSSYPHEILHNWWGNSVYVDADGGNWCEGLTAYMSDHLFAEQRGEGAVYRRATLKKFTDFVGGEDDVPLTEFRSRSSAASEAVGYGKSLMTFHMIRRAVGDETFLEALGDVAETARFRRAGFRDLGAAFTKASGRDWGPFFDAWTGRAGAPTLEVARAEAVREGGEWAVRVALRQSEVDAFFPMGVPVAVTVEGRDEPIWAEVEMAGTEAELRIPCPARPLRLDVDPAFDSMRRLDPLEVPPALSTLFGDDDPLFVLPSGAPAEELEAWRELAARWKGKGEPRTALDADLEELPAGSVWVLGWTNRFGERVARGLEPHGVTLDASGASLGAERVAREDSSLVLVARRAADPERAVGWVAADPPAAIAGLARKLPHYTRYSFLGFRGDEPENFAKGMWEPLASPLVRPLADGPLAELRPGRRAPLAELPAAFDASALRDAVAFLAAHDRQGRGLGSDGLEGATAWVEERFRALGLAPAGTDGGFRQSWRWTGGEPQREMTLTNVLGTIPGTSPDLAPVVLLAHLDHLGDGWPDVREEFRGRRHPGADDNASGVAVLLEVARVTKESAPGARPILFAVVTGEEAGRLGSKHLLDSLGDDRPPFACVNLDSVGRLADGKLYVLNADTAREWRFVFMGVGYTTGVASTIVSEPLDSSDQVSCIERGAPAVQLFTGPHADYHRPGDTADKLDLEGMTKVAEVTHEVVSYLAGRTDPLTITIGGAEAPAPAAGTRQGRRVFLGTMPDFSYSGPGVKVQQVIEGSPAQVAGVRAGDVLHALDGEATTDLRTYSALLKRYEPGDEVELTLERDGERLTARATLRAR